MDSIEQQFTTISAPPPPNKSKLSRTFKNFIHPKKSTHKSSLSNNPFCYLLPHERFKDGCCPIPDSFHTKLSQSDFKNRASMDAFIAKLFAAISSVKAAYAELQLAQFPYNSDAIQCSDQAVVDQLKTLSELKYKFMKKDFISSTPHVTLLLSEIQEQQSLMKMYEITMNKMEKEIEDEEGKISSLKKELNEIGSNNKAIETKLNSSGCFSILDNVNLSNLYPKDFITVLHYAVRSVRNYVKMLIREMGNANWDIDVAANAIEAGVAFRQTAHRCFAFEAFVCRQMFDGFNDPNFGLLNESIPGEGDHRSNSFYYHQFKKLKSANTIHFLKHNPNSTFGKFTRKKFLRLVHPKMEASFSGNLNQRKMVNVSEFPETAFFGTFAEMARRVWILHCLAFCFEDGVSAFQVPKKCRFSEVYMESVTDEVFSGNGSDLRVALTVVPGFKIGKTVVQSQVYLYS